MSARPWWPILADKGNFLGAYLSSLNVQISETTSLSRKQTFPFRKI